MKIFYLPAAVAALAILPLSGDIYILIRTLICGFAIWASIILYQTSGNLWVVFALIALIFNPILPLYLNNKPIWALIDLATAFAFVIIGGSKDAEESYGKAVKIFRKFVSPEKPLEDGDLSNTRDSSSQNRTENNVERNHNPKWKEEFSDFFQRLKTLEDGTIASVLICANHRRSNPNFDENDHVKIEFRNILNSPIELEKYDTYMNFMHLCETQVKKHQSNNDFNSASHMMIWLHTFRAICDHTLMSGVRDMWEELNRGRPLVENEIDSASFLLGFDEKLSPWEYSTAKTYYPKAIEYNEIRETGRLPNTAAVVQTSNLVIEPFLLQKGMIKGAKGTAFMESSISIGFINGWIFEFLDLWNIGDQYIVDSVVFYLYRKTAITTIFPRKDFKIEARLIIRDSEDKDFIRGEELGRKAAKAIAYNTSEKNEARMAWFKLYSDTSNSTK
ncbi:MAG: hypothetical protein P8L82_03430 [Paracoccaceae bacterium]|nr:hypothetical protein [Paracoccaceae bacterium]